MSSGPGYPKQDEGPDSSATEQSQIECGEDCCQFEQKLSMYDGIDQPIYMSDPDTFEILYLNPAMKNLFRDAAGTKCYAALQGLDGPCSFCTNKYILGENIGKTHTWEHQNRINRKWYRCIDKAFRWSSGKFIRYELAIDITNAKLAETRLRQRLEFEETISAVSSRFVGTYDLDSVIDATLADLGQLCNVSRAYLFCIDNDALTMTNTHEWCKEGVSSEKGNLQNIPLDSVPWWMSRLKEDDFIYVENIADLPAEAAYEKSVLEAQNIRSLLVFPLQIKGELGGFVGFDEVEIPKAWTDEDIFLLHIASGILGNALERRRSEDALRQSQLHLKAILDNIPDIVWLKDKESRFIAVNEQFGKACGLVPETLAGKTDLDIWPKELAELYRADDREVMIYGKRKQVEEPLADRAGKTQWIETIKTPIYNEQGQVVGTTGIARDITERKKVQDALRNSEETLRAITTTATDAIITMDNKRLVSFWNPAAEKLFGYSAKEVLGKELPFSLFPEETYDSFLKGFFDFQYAGKGPVIGRTQEFPAVRKNGAKISIEISTSAMQVNGKWEAVGIIRDVTRRRQMEEDLLRVQKLESIGVLAGGIAHEFNNLLMVVQGNISLMLLKTEKSDPRYQRLKKIETQVQNGAKLTKQLLGYARKGKYEVRPVDLNKLITEISETFGITQKDIVVELNLDRKIPTIEADQGQIEQVLWNLLVNASDAMSGGGRLTIKTALASDKDMSNKFYEPKPGEYVLFTVTDTGSGMDKKTSKRIFDPFFTTKEIGKGTGLGLAATYGIIKNHNGYIDVESKKGRGTTFTVFLPASGKQAHETVAAPEKFKKSSGTVLLVDDEEMVLEIGQEFLKILGYEVLMARDGKEAISFFKQNHDKVDLVLLDMVMPGLGGGKAYDKLKEINPDVKVLLSSGYSLDGEALEIMQRGCNGFIQKPFNLSDLSRKITKIMRKN